MAVSQLEPVLRHIRHLASSGNSSGPTDCQLLEKYLLDGDEEAFAVLVRRHGAMVLGVCRRVLRNLADAEDAFQATFLVLVSNASRIVNPESVGSWLHGVAYRTAIKAKVAARRRRAAERQAPLAATVEGGPDLIWRELRPVLDEEISLLPERYRVPVVLCYLEGKTNAEAAKLLRWPMGTVATRLARARQQLRKRLTMRGAALATGGLLAATVPASLRASVVQAAVRIAAGRPALNGVVSEQSVSLAKGVLQAMWMTKMRLIAAVLLALATVGAGAGLYIHQAFSTGAGMAVMNEMSAETPAGNEEAREERVLQLRNAAATDVANAVTAYMVEHAPELKDGTIVQPEPITNKLLISAPAGSFEKIMEVVKKLDADPPQIVITAMIMEVDADGHKDLISRPQIATSDNQTARVFVGQTYPIVTGTMTDAEGEEQPVIVPTPVGVELEIAPRIQPDGKILVRVHLTVSQVSPTNVQIGGGQTATAINSQTVEGTIEATDGELASFIAVPRTKTLKTEYKLPVLSELPILGPLFHFRKTSEERVELQLQLTPHIVRNRDECDKVLRQEANKIDKMVGDRLVLPQPIAMPD